MGGESGREWHPFGPPGPASAPPAAPGGSTPGKMYRRGGPSSAPGSPAAPLWPADPAGHGEPAPYAPAPAGHANPTSFAPAGHASAPVPTGYASSARYTPAEHANPTPYAPAGHAEPTPYAPAPTGHATPAPFVPEPAARPDVPAATAAPFVPAPALPSWPAATNPMALGAPRNHGHEAGVSGPPGRPYSSQGHDWGGSPSSQPGGPGVSGPMADPHAAAVPAQRTGAADAGWHAEAEPPPWQAGRRTNRAYQPPSRPGGGQLAMAVSSSLENSGSLTGHILSQGRADAPAARRNTTKVLLFGLVLLVLLVVMGLITASMAGDAVSDLFGGFAGS